MQYVELASLIITLKHLQGFSVEEAQRFQY